MFSKSAAFYDAVFSAKGKNYEAETLELDAIIRRFKRSPGKSLLEIASGTGGHTRYLRALYDVTGLDLDPEMLAIARARYPDVEFHCADMADFSLPRSFDVAICLFSAIGYVKTVERLVQAVATMARHLTPGGLLVVEPWLSPGQFKPGGVFATFVDEPELKVARMNVNAVRGTISLVDFHYLVATPGGVDHFTEIHELGLFTHEEYLSAFRSAGLETSFDEKGLIGRGMYVGVRPEVGQ